jgi:hypothetical protein
MNEMMVRLVSCRVRECRQAVIDATNKKRSKNNSIREVREREYVRECVASSTIQCVVVRVPVLFIV